jgi:hypothetical protein
LSWSQSGALPPGLAFDASGQLSGKPTTAGTYAFSVRVSDSSMPALTANTSVGLKITDSAIVIAPAAPPTGTETYPYPGFTFTASGGSPPYNWQSSGTMPPGLNVGSNGTVSGTPTQSGSFSFSVTATDSAQTPMSSAPLATQITIGAVAASFTTTGSMQIARSGHAATLLHSGKVLVTGGGNGTADQTAELYDPVTKTFSFTANNMINPRFGHTATLLGNGKVLIVGSGDASAELYDPATDSFAATGSLNHARSSPTATLLNTGTVLIVGGSTTANDATAELYDPASGTFSFTGNTTTVRSGHTATLLLDHSVLIAGGSTATAELYDPIHGTFTPTVGEMTVPRSGHTATLLGTPANALLSGDVLIIGAEGTAELFDHSKETFTAVGSASPYVINGHTATRRNDGSVLTAGGSRRLGWERCPNTGLESSGLATLFAPESEAFTITGSLNTPRDAHTATVLQDRTTVLVVGGIENRMPVPPVCGQTVRVVLSSAEVFQTQ